MLLQVFYTLQVWLRFGRMALTGFTELERFLSSVPLCPDMHRPTELLPLGGPLRVLKPAHLQELPDLAPNRWQWMTCNITRSIMQLSACLPSRLPRQCGVVPRYLVRITLVVILYLPSS